MNKKIDVLEVVPVDHSYGELLAALYQGGIQPQPWDQFLKLLRIRTDSDVAAMVFRYEDPSPSAASLWSSRRAPAQSQVAQYTKALEACGHADPLIDALSKTGGIFTLDQVVDRQALRSSSHYLNLMKPFGLEHAIGMQIDSLDGVSSFLALVRGPDQRNFDNETFDFLRQLKVHLNFAVRCRASQAKHEIGKQIYSEALSRLTIGTVILDSNGKVLEVNDAANGIMKRNDCISICEGNLIPAKSRYQREFNRLILNAITAWKSQLPDFVEALRIEGTTTDVGVLIRTAPHLTWYQGANVPCVIVHLDDFEGDESFSERTIASLFRLTRSEARLTACLARGMTLAEAAEHLNLTESSVRTYSKKIFSKTGVSRQADLVRLILKSVAQLARRTPAA